VAMAYESASFFSFSGNGRAKGHTGPWRRTAGVPGLPRSLRRSASFANGPRTTADTRGERPRHGGGTERRFLYSVSCVCACPHYAQCRSPSTRTCGVGRGGRCCFACCCCAVVFRPIALVNCFSIRRHVCTARTNRKAASGTLRASSLLGEKCIDHMWNISQAHKTPPSSPQPETHNGPN
jgi:hypothetical protein